MSASIGDVSKLYDLFHNGQTNYGSFVQGETEPNGKVRGKAELIYAAPTQVTFQRHCSGEQSMGLSPLNSQGKCTWGAIDIDKYEGHNLSVIVRAIYDFQIPLVPFYSKSKKLHLFAFFDQPIEASRVRTYLRGYVDMFDCDPKTEIFPKQVEGASTLKGTSSWINLPFFGNSRLMLGPQMEELPLEKAIDTLFDKRWRPEAHESFPATIPYNDAPPCIQKGAILRDFNSESHCRNNFLFSASVYLRMKDESDDVEGKLLELNNSFDEPIAEDRLRATVFSSLKKKTYFYLCKDMPGCDKPRCRRTEFGIDSKHSTGLDFGQIEQWLDDPPYYTWMVNGQKLIFYSESDIINQGKFREQVYRYLGIMPKRVKDEIWCKVVNKASQEHIIHDAPVYSGGFSKGSQFISHTSSFFNDRRMADHPSQLSLGRTYHDKGRDVFIFSAHAFLRYIREVKDFKVYSDMEIETKLKELGAKREGIYWTIDPNKVGYVEAKDDVQIDFHDREGEYGQAKY